MPLMCAVIGCGELVAPPGAHVRHDKTGLAIVCDASRETFRLVCVGRRWTGKLHNCTQPGELMAGAESLVPNCQSMINF